MVLPIVIRIRILISLFGKFIKLVGFTFNFNYFVWDTRKVIKLEFKMQLLFIYSKCVCVRMRKKNEQQKKKEKEKWVREV